MKKIVPMALIFCMVVSGCAKKNVSNNKSVLESSVSTENVSEQKDESLWSTEQISVKQEEVQKYFEREYVVSLNIGTVSDLFNVTDKPGSSTVIYYPKTGEKITVKKFITDLSEKTHYFEVETEEGITGYVKCYRNPFLNGDFEYGETLIVNGKEITALVFNTTLGQVSCSEVYKFPDLKSEVVYDCNFGDLNGVNATEITQDYEWVKISYNGVEGWIMADAVHYDRGGPTFYTPEATVKFFFYTNEI